MSITRRERLRLAEPTSGMGAVVLGLGLGVLASDRPDRVGLPLLLVGRGLSMHHTAGMVHFEVARSSGWGAWS